MHDCNECKFEEFFLTSWAVGDPAMIVDVHFDVLVRNGAGGAHLITGDYLFRDQVGIGFDNGLWGILRVN